MTAIDVTYRLFSPGSLTYVRDILKLLCGGEDAKDNQYLFRFPLPQFSSGKTEKVFTLGSRGRDFLSREVGMPVDWYFNPKHTRHLSHGLIIHNLTLTRFLVAAHVWCKRGTGFKLSELRTSYEMERHPATVEIVKSGKPERFKMIPDAWLLFDDLNENVRLPVLLEIDLGSSYRERFKCHVRSRIEFLRSGAYQKMFGAEGCVIAYATTGELPEYRQSRCNAMRDWTREVLTDMNLKSWAAILRFASVVREDMYEPGLFEAPVWLRPGSDSPLSLLEE
jgi:hypothetical protein